MPRILLALVLVFCTFAAGGVQLEPGTQIPATEGPWVVRAYFSDKSQLNLLARRTAPWEVRHDQGFAVIEVPNRYEYSQLVAAGFKVSIDPELTALLSNPGRGVRSVPGFACYRTVEETGASMNAIVAAHPGLASVIDIGDSWNKQYTPAAGYDLRVLKLSNSAISGPKPRVFIMGAIHAREYTTAETVIRFGESLIARYVDNADVRWMLDHHEVYLLPHANPDGRKKAELGQLWRKNLNEGYCGPTSNSRGADLNRNFPFEWGAHGGSSPAPCNDTFRGAGALSEPETTAIVAYVRSLFPDVRPPDFVTPAPNDTSGVFLDIHSYGGLVMWPWGFSESPAPNATALATFGRRLAWFNGYTPEQSVSLYVTDGTTKDFAYGDLGVASFSFELGTAFFEQCAEFEQNQLPNNLKALDYLLRVARRPYLDPRGPSVSSILSSPVEPGESLRVIASVSDEDFNQSNGVEPVNPISGVDAFLQQLPWLAGAVPDGLAIPLDGAFDSRREVAMVELSIGARPAGRYSVYLRGRDSVAGPVAAGFVDVVTPGSTASVRGSVRDSISLQPLATPAIVRLGSLGSASVPAQTSKYALRTPSGTYQMTVEASGYAPATFSNISLNAPFVYTRDITLDPLCSVFSDAAANLNNFTAQSPWAASTNRFFSSQTAFTESPGGNYGNNANLALTSNPLDLRDSHGLSLRFKSYCDTEAGWDFGRVEISTDGTQWTQIWSCNAFASWQSIDLPIPQLAGAANARIRFRFTSDSSQVRDGWSVDDIEILGAGAVCGSLPALLHVDGFE